MVYGNDDVGDLLSLGLKVSDDCSAGSGEDAPRVMEDSLLRLQESDLEMIRVLEDLIHLLIHKGVVRITDLPEAAQAKLSERGRAREALGGLTGLINDEEQGVI
ncbi:hypothetical protein D3C78_1442090 [compost metagenome]